jgi:hypothetical protein
MSHEARPRRVGEAQRNPPVIAVGYAALHPPYKLLSLLPFQRQYVDRDIQRVAAAADEDAF